MSRTLALDYGAARCGVALSDPSGTLATPLPVVERPGTRKGLGRVAELVADNDVERVVVGLPLSLSGDEGPQAAETREWASRLEQRLQNVPVELYDERLTTRQAERTGGSAAEDSRAAAHLLEAFLDARRQAA
jgi:putative Holliday junction resolvase